ncbi:MAG: hypothetical protein IPG69_13145 [Flavobacteriales bacterium]|nr:hypothetical protein [Flavobacteriales bacterium]
MLENARFHLVHDFSDGRVLFVEDLIDLSGIASDQFLVEVPGLVEVDEPFLTLWLFGSGYLGKCIG